MFLTPEIANFTLDCQLVKKLKIARVVIDKSTLLAVNSRPMNSDFETAFPEIFRRYRESVGLTRSGLAAVLGLDSSYIHRLEKGNRRPSRRTIIAMAEALRLPEEILNRWLIAAGHGPILFANRDDVTPVVHSGRSRRQEVTSNSSRANAARGTSLETLGLDHSTLNRLVNAIGLAPAAERKNLSSFLYKTVRLVTERLENPIRTAVIPAAGGSHRLVANHVMQRLLIKAIGEAAECGIHQVILVLAPEMEELFYLPLKESFGVVGASMVDLKCSIQRQPTGLGDAILRAEDSIGNQPFAVLLPDDVLNTRAGRNANVSELRLMMDALVKMPASHIVAVTEVSKRKMPNYGIAEIGAGSPLNNTLPIIRLIEKPNPSHSILSSSKALSVVGRYLLSPSIFPALRELSKRKHEPLELTAALERVRAKGDQIRAFPLRSIRQDFGEVLEQTNDLMEVNSASL